MRCNSLVVIKQMRATKQKRKDTHSKVWRCHEWEEKVPASDLPNVEWCNTGFGSVCESWRCMCTTVRWAAHVQTHTGITNAIKAPLHDLISMHFSTWTGAEGELTCIYLLSCCQTKHCCNWGQVSPGQPLIGSLLAFGQMSLLRKLPPIILPHAHVHYHNSNRQS